jgi:hypothetical protein
MQFPAYDYHDEEDDEDDEDDDEYIDTDSLGDWRNFRRSLALGIEDEEDSVDDVDNSSISAATQVSIKDDGDGERKFKRSNKSTRKSLSVKSVSKDNEEVLKSQNKDLADEYLNGVWAHETSTVRVLVCFCVVQDSISALFPHVLIPFN